jgi:hypothetical protein
MTTFGDRFRRAAAGVAKGPGLQRSPDTTLVRRADVVSVPPPSPRPRKELPAPLWPVCRACGQRHEPTPSPNPRTMSLLPWAADGRSERLGRQAGANVSSLVRDSTSAWTWGHRSPLLPDSRDRGQ